MATKLLILALAWAVVGCERLADLGVIAPVAATDRTAAAPPAAEAEGVTVEAVTEEETVLQDRASGGGGLAGAELYPGSGVLAGRPAARRTRVRAGADGRITLNFANADVREVINVILGETLNVSYVIDPAVQGTVTARTSEPLAESRVIPALENILALNGIALALEEGVYRVTTIEAAAGRLTRPALGRRLKPGFAINVIGLRHVSATALQQVLAPFVGPGRVLQVDAARNLLIFAGPGAEAVDLEDMVAVFDVDWMAGMSFALVPVEVAEVQAMVTDLEAVFAQDRDSPIAGVVRFVPIERLNAVLVISPQAAYLDQAMAWIDRLDRGSAGAGRRLFVYHVDNSDAVYLAEVLGQIFGLGGGAAPPAGAVAPDLEPVEIGQRAERPADGDDDGAAAPAARYAAERLAGAAPAVTNLISESGDIRIIADERNNALLVLATAAEFRMIEATLRKIDILPLQVLIEATIAEVTLNNDLRYGLQWFFRQHEDLRAGFSATQTNQTVAIDTFPAFPGFADPFPGFSVLLDTTDLKGLLNALSAVTDVNVISSPQLMVLDNQAARLQVGDEVPTITGSSVQTTDTTSPVVNNIQYRNTGVILEVKPHVNASGLVVLDVVQEVSNLSGTLLGSPVIAQRKIESIVAVQSGDTVALGGLIQDQQTDGYSGLPVLSEIPLLGNLFKVTTETDRRTELLVLITPRVVRDRTEARQVTEELRRRLSTVTPLEDRIQGRRSSRDRGAELIQDPPGGSARAISDATPGATLGVTNVGAITRPEPLPAVAVEPAAPVVDPPPADVAAEPETIATEPEDVAAMPADVAAMPADVAVPLTDAGNSANAVEAELPVMPAAGPPADPDPGKAEPTVTTEFRYVVQLGAFRHETFAEEAWRDLQSIAPELLGRLDHAVRRAEVANDDGSYFRLSTGQTTDQAAAEQLCAALQGRDIDCLVARRLLDL